MSLYAAWACNEGTGTTITDHSGNGRDMTITGSGNTWVTGVNYPDAFLAGASGSGAAWDGGSLLAALAGDVTLMGWYLHQGGSTTQEHTFGLFSAAATARLSVYSYRSLSGVAASPQLTVRNGSSTLFSFGANGTSADNSWHHVAVVYHSSGTVDEYLDGTLVNSYAASAAIGTEVRFAGSSSVLAGATAMSAVQDIRLFDEALTGTDVVSFMNTPVVNSSHTATASLTVTPSLSSAGAASRFRSAALTVAVALSASPAALHVPSAALTVTPSLSAAAGSTAPRTASLTVVPSLAAAPAAAHAPSASLSVVPAFSAAASHTGDVSHTASASLTVRPVLRATASHTGTELPGYPDPEAAVADLLADLVTAAYAGSRTLSVIQAGKLPALRTVRQAGGSSDRVTDTSVISVAVFAGSPDTAKAVAEQVRQRLVRGPFLSGASFRTAHGRIDKATVDQAPQLVTSPEVTAVQCATAVYQISMRR